MRQKSIARPITQSIAQQGFTLIELMVATAISAVIALLAYQSVDGVVRLKTQLAEKQQRLSELQRAFWQMEMDFTQMAPRPVAEGMGAALPAASLQGGQVAACTRIAAMPSPHQVGGLLRVRYALEGDQLYRWVWPVLDRSPDSQPNKILLVSGVKQFAVRFLNAKHQPQTVWPPIAAKKDLTALPKAIEVRLVLANGDEIVRFFAGVDGLPPVKQQGQR